MSSVLNLLNLRIIKTDVCRLSIASEMYKSRGQVRCLSWRQKF